MSTSVHEPRQSESHAAVDDSRGGGFQNLLPAEGDLRAVEDRPIAPSQTGVWVAMGAITMSFAALTSALVVRQGTGSDWQHIALPPILSLNTLALATSSAALEIARSRVAGYSRGKATSVAVPMRWLAVTLALGLLFVAGQYAAWLQLKARGLYLATNPNSSFFYVLTGLHAVHVLGGLVGLLYVISKLHRWVLRPSTFSAVALYWHFMGFLWLYLLLLLWMKL